MSNIQVDTTLQIEKNKPVFSSYSSTAYDVQYTEGFSFHLIWGNSSNITGTTFLEASLDGQNFVLIDGSTTKINGTTGSHVFDCSDFHYRFMRLRIELVSGDTEFTIYLNSRSRRV